MNKVLIKLYVPMIGEEYNIWLPLDRTIYSVIILIVEAIHEFTNGEYATNRLPILYDKKTAKPYNINLTVEESKILNGAEIVLI